MPMLGGVFFPYFFPPLSFQTTPVPSMVEVGACCRRQNDQRLLNEFEKQLRSKPPLGLVFGHRSYLSNTT